MIPLPYLMGVASFVPTIQNHWSSVVDHSRRYQDFTYVYPVISRRSRGLSIGINLNPDKRCNFDCVYCEVDRMTPGKATHVDLVQAAEELRWLARHAMRGGLGEEEKFREAGDLTRNIRDFAFSGDGEPTMVPNFDACVEMAVSVRRELGLSDTQVVLITDAAGLDKTTVRRGLEIMDSNLGEVWGKLDAGTDAYFRQVNRGFVAFGRILKNLTVTAQARPIVIQSLFLKLHGEIMSELELRSYIQRLQDILSVGGRIKEVHAYTIARPTPEVWATRMTLGELERLASVVRIETGLRVLTFD